MCVDEVSLVPSSFANVNGAWPALVLCSLCLRKLARLPDFISVTPLITRADLRMLCEALASLTCDAWPQAVLECTHSRLLPLGPSGTGWGPK